MAAPLVPVGHDRDTIFGDANTGCGAFPVERISLLSAGI